jgi:heme/copper-type cytochrome/quinol oxidase subunit 4
MNSEIAISPTDNHTYGLVLSWAALVGLTLLSWWFSEHGMAPTVAVTLILVLTFVKVFMVGHSFMEIGRGPRLMRALFVAWCVGTCAVLVVLAFAL